MLNLNFEESNDGSYNFFPIAEDQRLVLERMHTQFMCLKDPSKLEVRGSFDGSSARIIEIDFKRCTGSPECKSEQEVTDFLKGGYIVLLYNTNAFL